MHYVYIPKSLKNGDIYVGQTSDLKNRYQRHNLGRIKSTKAYVPWQLIYYEAYRSKKDITRRERQLKEHKPKNDLVKQIENSLKE